MQKLSLPVRLALLVAGSTLPLIVFASVIIFQNYERDRNAATARVLETTRSIRVLLDAEVQRFTGGLRVLSLTNSLRRGEFDTFRRISAGFLEQYPPGSVILVSDRDGRQLFSSVTTDTASLPPRRNLDIVQKVFDEKVPIYSDLFIGAVRKTLIVTVEMPVIDDGKVIYDLSFSPAIPFFQTLIENQRPSQDWTISIFDSKGVNFARVPNPAGTVGKPASPTLINQMFTSGEMSINSVSLEGVPLITSISHSPISGWIVGAGIAMSTLDNPLLRNLAITSAIGAIFLVVGVGFALQMARTIARGEMQHGLMVEELNHRVKNTLAILQAIASQTFRNSSQQERATFDGRLRALADAHDLLSEEKWVGAGIQDVVQRVIRPYALVDPSRIRIAGQNVPLPPPKAVMMSMILHEIATNAAKYGALSNETGTIDIDWQVADVTHAQQALTLNWRERGGPRVTAPTRKGFGSRLIERGARDQLGGKAATDMLPDGAVYSIECALP